MASLKQQIRNGLTFQCKSIDVDLDSVSVASLKEELFHEGPLEVGLRRWTSHVYVIRRGSISASKK